VEVCSPHSYIVELHGAKQHVHANRLKRYIVSSDCVIMQHFETVYCCNNNTDDLLLCNGCAVITDCDNDLGAAHSALEVLYGIALYKSTFTYLLT